MKTSLFISYLLLLFLVCTCSGSKTSYTLKINLKGYADKLYLKALSENGKLIPIDSIHLVNGQGIFKGRLDQPDVYFLALTSEETEYLDLFNAANLNNKNIAGIFLENTDMAVTGWADSLSTVKVTGSASQRKYDRFAHELQGKIKKIIEPMKKEFQTMGEDILSGLVKDDAQKEETTGTKFPLFDLLIEIQNVYYQSSIDFLKANPNSPVSPTILLGISPFVSAKELKQYINSFDPKFSSMPTVKLLNKQLKELENKATYPQKL